MGSALTVAEMRQVNSAGLVGAMLGSGDAALTDEVVAAVVQHGAIEGLVAQLSPLGIPAARLHAAHALWYGGSNSNVLQPVFKARSFRA